MSVEDCSVLIRNLIECEFFQRKPVLILDAVALVGQVDAVQLLLVVFRSQLVLLDDLLVEVDEGVGPVAQVGFDQRFAANFDGCFIGN